MSWGWRHCHGPPCRTQWPWGPLSCGQAFGRCLRDAGDLAACFTQGHLGSPWSRGTPELGKVPLARWGTSAIPGRPSGAVDGEKAKAWPCNIVEKAEEFGSGY